MVEQWSDFRKFEDMMNRMFEEFWGRPTTSRRLLSSGEGGAVVPAEQREPSIDVMESDSEITAKAEMPGIDKKDININVTEDRLEISAETKKEEKKEEKGYIYREMRSGSYYRSVPLPSPVDPENTKASYKDGVLEIKMPKTEVKKKTPVKVE